jgi:hypothetical protein
MGTEICISLLGKELPRLLLELPCYHGLNLFIYSLLALSWGWGGNGSHAVTGLNCMEPETPSWNGTHVLETIDHMKMDTGVQ